MFNYVCFGISTLALTIISITMLARANDQGFKKQWRWQLRMIGFILAGASPIGMIATEFLLKAWPSLYETIFRFGVAAVFFTTPQQKPWWHWVSKGEEQP